KAKERENIFFEYKPTSGFDNMAELPLQTWDAKGWDQGEKYATGSFVDKNFLGRLDLQDKSKFEEEASPKEYLAENYRAKEQIFAGYVRWDQNITEKTALILGARIEHTRIDYTGNNIKDEEEFEGEINNKNNYTNILLGVTLKHNFNDNFILRAAVTTSLARPNYYALAPFINTELDYKAIFVVNPNLKATYATKYDVMLEHYFQNVGIISGGAFYKNLKDFIYTYNDISFTADRFQ